MGSRSAGKLTKLLHRKPGARPFAGSRTGQLGAEEPLLSLADGGHGYLRGRRARRSRSMSCCARESLGRTGLEGGGPADSAALSPNGEPTSPRGCRGGNGSGGGPGTGGRIGPALGGMMTGRPARVWRGIRLCSGEKTEVVSQPPHGTLPAGESLRPQRAISETKLSLRHQRRHKRLATGLATGRRRRGRTQRQSRRGTIAGEWVRRVRIRRQWRRRVVRVLGDVAAVRGVVGVGHGYFRV